VADELDLVGVGIAGQAAGEGDDLG